MNYCLFMIVLNQKTYIVLKKYSNFKRKYGKIKGIFKESLLKSNYKNVSVKKSLFSLPLTYMGFSGYINPFTNEANINRKIPSTSLTFVINHEIAHQLGIAVKKMQILFHM